MPFMRAQGATQLRAASTYRTQLGQGATEYLVLLAVVLIVALVSVALLGFFPGMASDAQLTQSQTYWSSASPIAITETSAIVHSAQYPEYTFSYIRIRNSGAYPIRVTKMLGGTRGAYIDQVYDGATSSYKQISELFYLSPGAEAYFAYNHFANPERRVYFALSSLGASNGNNLNEASSICSPAGSAAPGTLQISNFGFEYIEYIDGQTITKREVGVKPLTIKCK